MADDTPQYAISVEEGEERAMCTAPLDGDDARYMLRSIVPNLRPLSDEEYMNGPAAILHAAARFSYVLYKRDVYWCIEWEPGLIVVRLTPTGTMAWTALRSPIPSFARRTPTEDDLRDYDENATNHQYNLVFRPWDAQFEEDVRDYRDFTRADAKTIGVYQIALEHVNALSQQLQSRYSAGADFNRWMDQCKLNLAQWAGDGIRVTK